MRKTKKLPVTLEGRRCDFVVRPPPPHMIAVAFVRRSGHLQHCAVCDVAASCVSFDIRSFYLF